MGESGQHIPSFDKKMTTPPKHFTEATLLQASLLSCLAGRNLIRVIQDPLLKSPELTGQWECKLREIEHGHYTLDRFMEELQSQLVTIIKDVKK